LTETATVRLALGLLHLGLADLRPAFPIATALTAALDGLRTRLLRLSLGRRPRVFAALLHALAAIAATLAESAATIVAITINILGRCGCRDQSRRGQ
jgi:hypothetical protein